MLMCLFLLESKEILFKANTIIMMTMMKTLIQKLEQDDALAS